MKALSLYREWIWAMRHLNVRVLNRTFALPAEAKNTWIAVHATKGSNGGASRKHLRWLRAMAEEAGLTSYWVDASYGPLAFVEHGVVLDIATEPRKAIVGAVQFVDCHRDPILWGAPKQYHWIIGEARWLDIPLDIYGQQDFWGVPEELTTQICEGLQLTKGEIS